MHRRHGAVSTDLEPSGRLQRLPSSRPARGSNTAGTPESARYRDRLNYPFAECPFRLTRAIII